MNQDKSRTEKSQVSFATLQQKTLSMVVDYCSGLEFMGEEPKALLAIANTLTQLVKRSRKAITDRDIWQTLLTTAVETLLQILKELGACPDVPNAINAKILTMLVALNELSEREAEIERQQSDEFEIDPEEIKALFALVVE